MVSTVGDDPRFAAAIALGLDAGIDEIELLNALDLDVQLTSAALANIRTIRAARKLLTTAGVKTVLAQLRQTLNSPTAPFSGC